MRLLAKAFLDSFLFLWLIFFVLEFFLAILITTGAVSPRQFGLGSLLLMGGLYIALVYRYRRARRIALDAGQIKKARRAAWVMVVVMPIALVLGLWTTWGAPLGPRLVGISINLLITWHFISVLRRTRGDTALD